MRLALALFGATIAIVDEGEFSAPLAIAAVTVWCATAVIGAFAAHRGWRAWRSGRSSAK